MQCLLAIHGLKFEAYCYLSIIVFILLSTSVFADTLGKGVEQNDIARISGYSVGEIALVPVLIISRLIQMSFYEYRK